MAVIDDEFRRLRDFYQSLVGQQQELRTLVAAKQSWITTGQFHFFWDEVSRIRNTFPTLLPAARIEDFLTEGANDTYEVHPILAYIATALPRMNSHLNTQENAQDIDLIERICKRFHLVTKQLESRHDNRKTLTITDEYDVQDLLHALLRLFFDDVRPEECTPSYAGGSARMDFLLKGESIVVETKKTRSGLKQREIGTQLILKCVFR